MGRGDGSPGYRPPERDPAELLGKAVNYFVDQASKKLIDHIQRSFEQAADAREKLPFHNVEHTKSVMDRTVKIMTAMKEGGVAISPKDVAIAKLAASAHDVIQLWEVNVVGDKQMRKRMVGKNESLSIEQLQDVMKKQNKDKNFIIFSQADLDTVREAIEATVPGFDPELNTVVQPNLNHDSRPVTRAVAMADLGEAGMNTEAYIRGGDALFREENLDMLNLDPSKVDPAQKEAFRLRMLGWSKFQAPFARGRKAVFERDIAPLPALAQEKLRALFSKFDETIAQVEAIGKRREAMSFEELYLDMYGEELEDVVAA